MVFPRPIFMKMSNCQQQFVKLSYAECHSDLTIHVDSMVINSCLRKQKV